MFPGHGNCPGHIHVLRDHGVGRVSMGIQSLDQQILERINRQHSPDIALRACELLTDSGFVVNIDLIYGLPGQSMTSFREDFEQVARRGVQSVTVYDLRLNEKTRVSRSLEEEERLELSRLVDWRRFVKEVAAEFGFTQTRCWWRRFPGNLRGLSLSGILDNTQLALEVLRRRP